MSEDLRLRQAVRAVVLDPANRLLLVRFEFPHVALWAAPGGGLKPGEGPHDGLRRELAEETGLSGVRIGPEIWVRTHVFPFQDGSHDGQVERFYLIRAEPFEPSPTLSWEQLRDEYVTGIRWWSLGELQTADSVFAPRLLPELVARLVSEGPPSEPIDAGV